MKKKGLIIATIVMVLVLAVSLTTATYAWFSADAKTSIQGFDVKVVSNNVVNIGLKGSTYNNGSSADEFVSGDCVYTQGAKTSGSTEYGFGTWTGNTSLAPQISTTDVNWGTQSKAVGFIASHGAAANTATGTNTLFVPNVATNAFTPIAANGTGTGSTSITGTPEYALENYTANNGEQTETAGAFAYLFLGVQATKQLQTGTNKFTIILQPQGTGTTLGIAAAIHVAHREKIGSGAWTNWTDVDVYDAKHYGDARSTVAAQTLNGDFTTELGTGNTYASGSNTTTTATGYGKVSITLSDYSDTSSPAPIDQIEIIIYLAGADTDCINSAINGLATKVFMFFEAQEYVAPQNP